jgi:hypothetical protein
VAIEPVNAIRPAAGKNSEEIGHEEARKVTKKEVGGEGEANLKREC